MSELEPIELLRRFHEHADKWENHVGTDEVYWADNGEEICRARRWYFESDLRRQTIAALTQHRQRIA